MSPNVFVKYLASPAEEADPKTSDIFFLMLKGSALGAGALSEGGAATECRSARARSWNGSCCFCHVSCIFLKKYSSYKSWEMKLGGYTKIGKNSLYSRDDLLVAKDPCCWKKAMKRVQAAKARSGSYAQLPTKRRSKSQQCTKHWTA